MHAAQLRTQSPLLGRYQSRRAGAVITAAGMVAITPLVWSHGATSPGAAAIAAVERSIQLASDGASLLNVPLNLFQDIVNIPGTEVEAVNTMAKSLFFTGNWFTPSATNLWGEDPGDPGHFMGLVDMFIPFKEISGLGSPEIDPAADAAGTAGLGQQLALLAAAELPVSASCDADWCAPLVPVTPITGFSALDRTIWSLLTVTGLQKFPLFNNWFQVPLSDLTHGYHFGNVVDPSAGIGEDGAVPGGFGFPGTHFSDPDNPADSVSLMPWANSDFTFNPAAPFQNFFTSLEQPVDLQTYAQGFDIPTFTEMGRAMQALLAGMVVDFNPYVAGSPACFGSCLLPGEGTWTTDGMVKGIGDLWPGNKLIDEYLDAVHAGTANGATEHQIQFAIDFLQGQQDNFDIGNPSPADPSNVDTPEPFAIGPVGQELIDFMQNTGVLNFTTELADLFGFDPDNNPGGFIEALDAANAQWVDFINSVL